MNKFSMRYEDVETNTLQVPNNTRPSVSAANKTKVQVMSAVQTIPQPPPLVNPQLFTSNPVPASAFLMAAAAAGERTAIDTSNKITNNVAVLPKTLSSR